MRHQILSHLPLAIGTHAPPTLWVSAWERAHGAVRAILAEASLYACDSPCSRLYGRAVLQKSNARLRRDIGLAANTPEAMS